MSMLRRSVLAEISSLGEDEVEIRMSTGQIARDGHVLVPAGCQLDNYRRNPIQLWQHDPEYPVGLNQDIRIEGDAIVARTRFAELGVSAKADEVRGLVKGGIVRAVSVGFEPIEGEPLDPKRPRGGQRFTKWELLECSFVSVPADTGALVTARAHGEHGMDDTEGAGNHRPAGQIRSYRTVAPVRLRGMYAVGRLAWLLEDLAGEKACAEWEASIEGDGSPVPAMLATALQNLGAALIAMTEEEVAELIGDDEGDDDDGFGLDEADTTIILASAQPALKRFRTGYFRARALMTRAGRKLSAETLRCMRDALDHHDEAMDQHRAAIRSHKRCAGAIRGLLDSADEDSTEVQTSDGGDDSEGSENNRQSVDFERRQAELKELAAA